MVGGKSGTRMKKLVEAADKSLVVQAQTPDHRVQALPHLLRILVFEVVVQKDDHRQRKGLRREDIDFLLHIVFKDAKFVTLQVRNKITGSVLHRDRKNHQI